jgi:hypothetical protein
LGGCFMFAVKLLLKLALPMAPVVLSMSVS